MPTDRLFTGQRLDATGLYYYGARYYDPAIGRFISADTVVQNLANPQTLNRYSYVVNNPLRYIDPTGRVYVDDGQGNWYWAPDDEPVPETPYHDWGNIYEDWIQHELDQQTGSPEPDLPLGPSQPVVPMQPSYATVSAAELVVGGLTWEVILAGLGIAAADVTAAGAAALITGLLLLKGDTNPDISNGAKSQSQCDKHVAELEEARQQLKGLEHQLEVSKSPKERGAIQSEIDHKHGNISGLEKEIRQKWPNGRINTTKRGQHD